MLVDIVPLTSFRHGHINAHEGRALRIERAIANELERHGLVRIRLAPPKPAVVKGRGVWQGATVVCIASGASITDEDVEIVREWREASPQSRKVIAVCTAFRKAPWADVLYAGDNQWWREYGAEVERDFKGELWTGAERIDGVNHIECVDEPGLSTKPGRVHYGGNSGYQAMGFAYDRGAAVIVLLAYDMQRGPRGEAHFHGKHRGGLSNPVRMDEWARRMIQLGADLRAHGVQVINASRATAIRCFERLPIQYALNRSPAAVARTVSLLVPQDLLPREHMAFVKGLSTAGFTPDPHPSVTVVWNCRMPKPRPTGTLVVAENGYLDGPGGPYVALALDGHNGAGRTPHGGPERFDRLGVELKPWRTDGGHILICENRGLDEPWLRPPKDWTAQTIAELKRYTDRPIKVRKHPGNWKRLPEHPDVGLARDLEGAWACVIWRSGAGLRALARGVPVIYTAPHWIAGAAAGTKLEEIEAPPMPDRLPVFQRLAWAQWTLDEIETGAPFKALTSMLTVLCVLRSGGDYTPEYVRRLRDGVMRNITVPHRFVCLSDVEVPCERIPLKHDWPGWWSKLEVFRPDVIKGKTLYLDLDTVIVGNLDAVADIGFDFSMLNVREKDTKVGNSGAMWIGKPFPHVYERFAEKPQHWIDYHVQNAQSRYMGDQAFISDCFEDIPKLHHALPGFFKSYKYDSCQTEIPPGCSVVCFGGKPRPHEAGGWVRKVWT